MKKPEDCASFEDVRRGIDALDREIIALIGERSRYVVAAARYKTSESSVRAPERQHRMLAQRRRWAEEEGLSPDVIETIYRNLLQYFIARETNHWHNADRAPTSYSDQPVRHRLIENDSQQIST